MPPRSEMLADGTVGRQKPLSVPRRCEALHATFPLASRSMRVLTAVVEIATLTMLHAVENLAFGRTIAPQLVGDGGKTHVQRATTTPLGGVPQVQQPDGVACHKSHRGPRHRHPRQALVPNAQTPCRRGIEALIVLESVLHVLEHGLLNWVSHTRVAWHSLQYEPVDPHCASGMNRE